MKAGRLDKLEVVYERECVIGVPVYVGVRVVLESVPVRWSLEEVRYGLEYTGGSLSAYECDIL